MCQLAYLCHCPHAHVSVAQLVPHGVVLHVERLQIGEGGDLIEDDGVEELAGLH